MRLNKRKLILTLVFILVAASLLRVLRITLTTSSLSLSDSSPKPVLNTKHSTQLSEKELRFLSNVIAQRSPCNLLVFGAEEQYLKLSAINAGGTTIFLDDHRPEKLDQMKGSESNATRVFRVQYKTYTKEAYKLLKNASCSLRSERVSNKCKIALTGLPMEVTKTKWDVIVVDGPETPRRMGAIFVAGVLARSANGSNVVVHDVYGTIEKWFSWEFLSEKNLVSSKGKFWNFRIPPRVLPRHFDLHKHVHI